MVAMKRRVVEQRDSIIREGGLLLYDSAEGELSQEGIDYQVNSIPATKIAQNEIKEIRSANIVLLGAMTRLLKEIDLDVVREIIQKYIPKPELNIEALEAGISLIEEQTSVV